MKITRTLVKRCLTGVALALLVISIGVHLYSASLPDRIRVADKRAHEFCDVIAIGSDICAAVTKAKAESIFWGAAQGYTFYFPATSFDKAVCEVTVDREGRVLTKNAEMEYD